MGGIFSALTRTRKNLPPEISGEDEGAFAALRDGLILADAGAGTAEDIIRNAKNAAGENPAARTAAVIAKRLAVLEASMAQGAQNPFVIMVMGVNGCGKTTTIAKLCRYFRARGKRVLLSAGDTFRAAAEEQLQEWARRTGAAEIVTAKNPSAAAFEGVAAGIARACDIVIVDTAGRLPPQKHLMAELAKIRRAAGKALPGAPHELLLVADATLGRNSLRQMEAFSAAAGVTGVVLSKLDGSAKGGFLLSMAAEMPRPVRFVGTGEGADDLDLFNAADYARALVGLK